MKTVTIIGAGFSGLSAACYLAKAGYKVEVFEKNNTTGGRARQYHEKGFTFDMGPTFYWMPDVLERFFADFNHKPSDYYSLKQLDPGYEVYFGPGYSLKVPAAWDKLVQLFEELERGSSRFLHRFIKEAGFNYRVAMEEVVYKPGFSPSELISGTTITRLGQFVTSLRYKVRSGISHAELRQLLEFPVLFLGAKPSDIPAFYCFMNYADLVLGTWHVEGGIYNVIRGMQTLAESLGVRIYTSLPVEKIVVAEEKTIGVCAGGHFYPSDVVVAGADYHHAETLLKKSYRNYKEEYWEKKVMAPSALLYYIAFDRKIENISHHTLFFDADFDQHAEKIYDYPGWPEEPLFYASFPSCTDLAMAPENKENAIVLIPLAVGLEDTPAIREHYFQQVIRRMEHMTRQTLEKDVLFYRSYSVSNFIKDYNAYKGNAYGLSNILMQTAFLKPKIKNKKIPNLFYTGQLTVPGPGIPPAVISGKIAAEQALAYLSDSGKQKVYNKGKEYKHG